MNHKLYKPIVTLIAICFLGNTFAQKFNKKFTENFKVNKDVEVAINASNTEINVTTWNKNEVQVQAFIEIEGLSKEEAEKYFKNWSFEALGNKSKVKITSQGNNSLGVRNDFVIFNNMDFNFPDIQMPNLDSIINPDMNFDFDFDFDHEDILEDLDDLEKNMKKDDKYSFEYHDDNEHIVIKSKKEWKEFKKTKKYKDLKLKMLQNKAKMHYNLYITKEKMKKSLAKAKLEYQKVDKAEIKRALAGAKKHIMEMKLNFNSDSDNITIDGKKIKIKKRLEIKVPKNATFDLNTRHCKVKLPNTVASGKVSYGSFFANNIKGGELTINNSPVIINGLFDSKLFLNNVKDAQFAFIQNSTLSSNFSMIEIQVIDNYVNISDKFGELTINKFYPKFDKFVLNLSNSNAILNFNKVKTSITYNLVKSKIDTQANKDFFKIKFNAEEVINSKTTTINSLFNNYFELNSEFSNIMIK